MKTQDYLVERDEMELYLPDYHVLPLTCDTFDVLFDGNLNLYARFSKS